MGNFKNMLFLSLVILLQSGCSSANSLAVCPPDGIIEWVDVLMIDDLKYDQPFPNSANESLSITFEKGQELGKVTYRMADSACSNYKMQNSDATYLKEGTIIYEIKGYPASLLVTANDAVYIVVTNYKAETVAELYPMHNLVKNIYIESTEDGNRIHTFSQSS